MNIHNLWFEENKKKYHQFLSEIVKRFITQKSQYNYIGVLMSSGWSSLIRVTAVEKKYTQRACSKDF